MKTYVPITLWKNVIYEFCIENRYALMFGEEVTKPRPVSTESF